MKTRAELNSKIQKEIFREERDKKARKIIKVISIILTIILSILCYGMFIGAKYTLVHEYKITNDNVPDNFHGIKIVQISDILFDSLNKNDLNKLKKMINDLKSDILVFTGDIKRKDYDLEKSDLTNLEDFFKGLKASISKYAVKGDLDDDSFYVIMENSNFKVLNNQQELLYYNGTTPIEIIGFTTDDLKLNIEKSDYYSICLLHNPDKITDITKEVNCNLALAGDTLKGEIVVPFLNTPIFDNHQYNKDYYKLKNTELYISNGLGNNMNIRLFNHPSINLYRLTKY